MGGDPPLRGGIPELRSGIPKFSPPQTKRKTPVGSSRCGRRGQWPVLRSTGRSMTAKMAQEDGVERARTR